MTAPLFTFDPTISFVNSNTVVLTGTESGDFNKVEVDAENGNVTDLGSPQITNGHWSLDVNLSTLGSGASFVLSATDKIGVVDKFGSNYSVLPGIKDHPYTTFFLDKVNASSFNMAFFDQNGSQTYHANETINSSSNVSLAETGDHLNASFVFINGTGTLSQTITNFHATGADHDTVALPSSDFTSLADVIRHTTVSNGNATIHDPNSSGATLTLMGVTKAEMKSHPHDFTFHGTGSFM